MYVINGQKTGKQLVLAFREQFQTVFKQGRIACYQPQCKGFQNKRTDISCIVLGVKKPRFGPYQGLSFDLTDIEKWYGWSNVCN